MITLFLIACQVEWKQIDTRHITTQFLDEQSKTRTLEDLWTEQCVLKKEMGI